MSKKMQEKKKRRKERREPGFHATLTNLRISPRKLKLIADLVRGRSAQAAIDELRFAHRKYAVAVMKLIQAAVAQASQQRSVDVDRLFVKKIAVNKAVVMKRFMARARGSADTILKRSAHITLILDQKAA